MNISLDRLATLRAQRDGAAARAAVAAKCEADRHAARLAALRVFGQCDAAESMTFAQIAAVVEYLDGCAGQGRRAHLRLDADAWADEARDHPRLHVRSRDEFEAWARGVADVYRML